MHTREVARDGDDRIRVALLIPTMDRGGAEKQVVLLARHLPRDQFDVHVMLLTRDGPRSDELRAADINVTVIGKHGRFDPTALFRLRAALRRFQPHVLHTFLFAANSFGRVAGRWAGVPVVIASERSVDPWKSGWQLAIDRYLAKHCRAITTNSPGVVDFYVSHGIDAERFEVISNGIEARTESRIERAEAFRRLGVGEDCRLILAVGRLWPQKRYRDLIWAAELLATIREDVRLVIVGDGPQRGELLRHRDAVTRPDRVIFVGDRDDVGDLLPHAEAFWIASEYEGQSNAVIEAMLAGLPVIASDIPGNRDLVIDGETGKLVTLGDTADFARQTELVLADAGLAERLGNAGRRRIESDFTIDAMVSAHSALYRRLLGRSGGDVADS